MRRKLSPKRGICLCVVFILVIYCFFLSPQNTRVYHAVASGKLHISEDTVWEPEGSPYLIDGELVIDQNVTLTVAPGTIITFAPGSKMTVDGYLSANADGEQQTVFTSVYDPEYSGIEFKLTDYWDGIYISETGYFDGTGVRASYGERIFNIDGSLNLSQSEVTNAKYNCVYIGQSGVFNGYDTLISDVASLMPISTPTVEPTNTPTVEPTSTPTVEPTSTFTVEPTNTPTVKPTCSPIIKPTCKKTTKPGCKVKPSCKPKYPEKPYHQDRKDYPAKSCKPVFKESYTKWFKVFYNENASSKKQDRNCSFIGRDTNKFDGCKKTVVCRSCEKVSFKKLCYIYPKCKCRPSCPVKPTSTPVVKPTLKPTRTPTATPIHVATNTPNITPTPDTTKTPTTTPTTTPTPETTNKPTTTPPINVDINCIIYNEGVMNLTSCGISNCSNVGIYVGSNASFYGGDLVINDCGTGVLVEGTVSFLQATITDCIYGVYSISENPVNFEYCIFENISSYAIVNDIESNEITASNNYWQSLSGPSVYDRETGTWVGDGLKILGNIIYQPFLSEPEI
ncbi:MAG: putative hemoglobin and hemoglobin-haptoglobin-binding protein 3 precursor [Firmicutes bacterium ADurb.Bin419]|nr:MAG: putative hemoglobin and hemoglobin-haptoglobin-binding protein 3 precursor [Firmicutes bacterium ADurb.Bin419]